MTFGERLKSLRQRRGLTQLELAERSGLSMSYIFNLEDDRHKRPSGQTVDALATALGVSVNELLGSESIEADVFPPDIVEFAKEIALLEADERRDILTWARGYMASKRKQNEPRVLPD